MFKTFTKMIVNFGKTMKIINTSLHETLDEELFEAKKKRIEIAKRYFELGESIEGVNKKLNIDYEQECEEIKRIEDEKKAQEEEEKKQYISNLPNSSHSFSTDERSKIRTRPKHRVTLTSPFQKLNQETKTNENAEDLSHTSAESLVEVESQKKYVTKNAEVKTIDFKRYNYKDLPIKDGKQYTGYIRKVYLDSQHDILLEIENIGTYKVKLPKRKPWDELEKNVPFIFVREKYQGTGKQSQYIYSKLVIIEVKRNTVSTKVKCQGENKIAYYDIYHPWHGGRNPEFNSFSGQILDLKNGKPSAINHFFNVLKNVDFDKADIIVIVPSHDPENRSSSVKKLAKKLAQYQSLIDGTDVVLREQKIGKLSKGGNRDVSVHLNSLAIQNPSLIDGKNILVFDDVSTTGNSLHATMQLLKRHGAYSVCSYVIGHTG